MSDDAAFREMLNARFTDLANRLDAVGSSVAQLSGKVGELAEASARADEQRKSTGSEVSRLASADAAVSAAVAELRQITTAQHASMDDRMKRLETAEAERVGAGAAWSVVTSGLSTFPLYVVMAIWYLTGRLPPPTLINALSTATGSGASVPAIVGEP